MSVNIADRDLIEDPHGYEEPEEFTLRQYLGLRPIALHEDGEKGAHPDQRPCPPWCDTGNSVYGHQICPQDPYAADHGSTVVALPASNYYGSVDRSGKRLVIPATFECYLSQRGHDDTKIHVSLRHAKEGEGQVRFQERLRLSVDDARDLIATLTYLVGLTEHDQ